MNQGTGFLDPGNFPFVEQLERNAPIIRAELDSLPAYRFVRSKHRFIPTGGKEALSRMVHAEGWDVFAVYRFGRTINANAALCPLTTEIVGKIPELLTAGFSRLSGGAHIKPHSGTSDLVRCHLGLVIPPSCRFRVGDETRRWEENKCLLFDNLVEHEVWNDSAEDRIVLVADFMKKRGPA